VLPSGKRLHSELEKTSSLIDKSTINVSFSIAMLNYQRASSISDIYLRLP
jgi:hypothetical protein